MFIKRNILLIIGILFISGLSAQVSYGGQPYNWLDKHVDFEELNPLVFEELNMAEVRAADEVTDQYKETPYRFGIEHDVNFDVLEMGIKMELENGSEVYQLAIECEKATSISLNFGEYIIPKNCEVYIWNSDRSEFLGKFDHRNAPKKNSMAVGLLHDDLIVVELTVPAGVTEDIALKITQVVHGYRDIVNKFETEDRGPFGNSGACNINVNCPEGSDWEIEKKAVALIVSGGFAVCSGALVNNTNNDGTPYFLTANHCLGGGVGSWLFYFNHESENCAGSSGPTNQSISGSELIASNGASDFGLLLLDETPPSEYDVQYSGWDATDALSVTSTTGIHHPSGDVKKICFDEDSPYHNNVAGAAVWYIDEWEDGVTEGGSSGSPLFDQNHRIIGQLYGGFAACAGSTNNGQADWYGRFGVSWDGSSPSTRLRDWLDPSNSGVLVLDGFPEGFAVAENDVASAGIEGIDGSVCSSSINPVVIVRNNGSETLTSCLITYSANGGALQNYNWTGNLEQNEQEEVTLGTIFLEDGDNVLEVEMTNPNGLTDGNDFNNTSSVEFNAFTGNIYSFNIEITLDDFGSETTWQITSGGDTFYTGGPWSDDNDGMVVNDVVCIGEGCYTFAIFDSFGDGICCGFGDGSYTVYSQDGGISASGGDFEDFEITSICTPPTNVNENSFEDSFKIYPNPVSNMLIIETETPLENSNLRLLNVAGQAVVTENYSNMSRIQIETQNFAPGFYILEIQSGELNMSKKIIIE